MSLIHLQNVTVEFPVVDADSRSLRRTLISAGSGGRILASATHRRRLLVRAIEDLSLELKEGDRMALIGHNGAGKSTLLRTIAGVFEPVAGNVVTEGRMASLLDVNPGLDFDDTGYENIIAGGLMLGMSPEEIRRKTADIADFTELGDYLALPVRTYSSGMQVRLAFAISTAIEPEITLLDEGFGTTDIHFTEKARQRLFRLVERSSILMLATHSEELIRELCNRAILMEHGRLAMNGTVDEVLTYYHQSRSP